MTRHVLILVVALGVLATTLLGEEANNQTAAKASKPEPKAKAEKPIDMLASVKEWNSDKYAGPPTQFRQGHVTPRKLDESATAVQKAGFTVSLPSKSPIPTPTVYGGKVYVSGGFHSKEFYCLDAQTGKLVWGVNLDDDGPTAAVCEQDVVVFNTESCTLFALDAKNGKQLWSLWLGDPLTSTPTIANGKVFTSYPARGGASAPGKNATGKGAAGKGQAKTVPPCSHVLAALELKTGKILWQRWIESDVMSAPVAVEKEVYATSFAGVVYRFNQEDGAMLSAVKSRATSAPVVAGNRVFYTRRSDAGKDKPGEAVAGGERGSLQEKFAGASKPADYLNDKVQDLAVLKAESAKLDAGNGFAGGAPAAANAQAGRGNIGQSNVSSLQAFQGSRILNYRDRNYNCMGDEIVCTDPASGKEQWKVKLQGDLKKMGGFLASPPAAAGGQLFLATLQGEVLQVSPETGKVVKTYKVGSQVRFQPAVVEGKIYVGTQDGKLVCIDTGDKQFTGWPCWGGNAAHTGTTGEKKGK